MPNLTIKEIPEQLLEQLRRRAAHRRHSVNREVILCLGRATELPVLEPSRWLADADRLRARLDREMYLVVEHVELKDVPRARDYVRKQFDKI